MPTRYLLQQIISTFPLEGNDPTQVWRTKLHDDTIAHPYRLKRFLTKFDRRFLSQTLDNFKVTFLSSKVSRTLAQIVLAVFFCKLKPAIFIKSAAVMMFENLLFIIFPMSCLIMSQANARRRSRKRKPNDALLTWRHALRN